MHIGIIVFSHTGHTLSVAEKLKETLASAGHCVELERVVPEREEPSEAGKGGLKTIPDPGKYDALVFAAPVWAFSLSAVMRLYLEQLPSLQGKKVGLFVTQAFSHAFFGGNRAIRQMKSLCRGKGAAVVGTGVVSWSEKQRASRTAKLLEAFQTIF